MQTGEKQNVYKAYNKIAQWYAQNRDTSLKEINYLKFITDHLPPNGEVLDMGCGTGKPIIEYFVNNGINVTGTDASSEILALAKANFPLTKFFLQDMRLLSLDKKFDAIIAWDSFFHLPVADQRGMFSVFERHLQPQGLLLFTTGTEHGEAWGVNGGENLYHASFNTDEYKQLLMAHNFTVLQHTVNDPDCRYATVWVTQYKSSAYP